MRATGGDREAFECILDEVYMFRGIATGGESFLFQSHGMIDALSESELCWIMSRVASNTARQFSFFFYFSIYGFREGDGERGMVC